MTASDFPYAEIEKRLGYAFQDRGLLLRAFVHSTYGNIHKAEDNERLEYLGDAVVDLVVRERQYKKTEGSAGQMTKQKQHLVNLAALDTATDALGIYPYLLYCGKKENLGDKTKSSLFEAVTAAIYLDGGYEAAKAFVFAHGNMQFSAEKHNYKGELQEFLQSYGEKPPQYLSKKEGSDHAPIFYCTVRAMGERAEGVGKNRQQAEMEAASRLLWELTAKVKRQKGKK